MIRNTSDIVSDLLSGAGTYPVASDQIVPTTGYAVAVLNVSKAIDLAYFLDNHKHTMWARNQFIGSWQDSNTGILYIDVVAIFDDLDYALEVAREKNEIAIWDLKHNEEIRVS